MKNLTTRLLLMLRLGFLLPLVVGALRACGRMMPHAWRMISDLSTLQSLAQIAGITIPILVAIVISPWFDLGLIVFGLAGLPAVVQSQKSVKISWAWPIIGWTGSTFALAAVIGTLLFGVFVKQSNILTPERIYDAKLAFQQQVEPNAQNLKSTHQASGLTPAMIAHNLSSLGSIQAQLALDSIRGHLITTSGYIQDIIVIGGLAVYKIGVGDESFNCMFGRQVFNLIEPYKVGDKMSVTGAIQDYNAGGGVQLSNCVLEK